MSWAIDPKGWLCTFDSRRRSILARSLARSEREGDSAGVILQFYSINMVNQLKMLNFSRYRQTELKLI